MRNLVLEVRLVVMQCGCAVVQLPPTWRAPLRGYCLILVALALANALSDRRCMSNDHVLAYLEEYFALKAPGYAVLIDGKWGTGKTWLLREALRKADRVQSYYLSWYGVRDTKQIDDEIFRQAHPKLNSKAFKVTAAVSKALLRGAFKIDFDGDKKEDASLSPQIPELKIAEFLNSAPGVFVFDDLERAALPLEVALGYMNHLVEIEGRPLVVVANREVVEDSNPAIRSLWEKLVGRVLSVRPDVESATRAFADELTSPTAKDCILDHIPQISAILRASTGDNLRSVRQALYEFDRLLAKLDPIHRQNKRLVSDILQVTLALVLELRVGALTADQVANLGGWEFEEATRKEGKGEGFRAMFAARYVGLLPSDWLLSMRLWADVLSTGEIDSLRINAELSGGRYYYTENTPKWQQLWHYFDLADEVFASLAAEVEQDFRAHRMRDPEEIAQTAGILIHLCRYGVVQNSDANALRDDAIACIDLIPTSSLLGCVKVVEEIVERRASRSLGLHDRDSDQMKAVVEHLGRRLVQAEDEALPAKGQALLSLLPGNVQQFAGEIAMIGARAGALCSVPVFCHVDASVFADAISRVGNDEMAYVNLAFRKRYEPELLALEAELPWLSLVAQALQEVASQPSRSISRLHIGQLAENMTRAASTMELRIETRRRQQSAIVSVLT